MCGAATLLAFTGDAIGHQDDERIIMVGASFKEIAVEAGRLAKIEIDKELERIKDKTLGCLTQAQEAVQHAITSYKRQTKLLYLLLALCGIEAGIIVALVLALLRHIYLSKC